MAVTNMLPGEMPVSLNEARGWLRMGATIDDAVVAGLVRAATNICEAFIGQWLIERAAEETVPLSGGAATLSPRPVIALDGVTLLLPETAEILPAERYHLTVARDGTGRVAIVDPGQAERVRITCRAGIAADANGVPEAIRQGIVRMTQHLHDARDDDDVAPPAMIAALWKPWRRLTLGGGR